MFQHLGLVAVAALQMWFAIGYLGGLLDDGPQIGPVQGGPDGDQVAVLCNCLQWLKTVHAGGRDNDCVDTGTVLEAFKACADASLEGIRFRLNLPKAGKGKQMFPEFANDPLPLSEKDVVLQSRVAKKRIFPLARMLGQMHRPGN